MDELIRDLIQFRSGEEVISLLFESIIADVKEIPDNSDPMLNVIMVMKLGYEIEGEKGRMN
jgi:hypothetical protein